MEEKLAISENAHRRQVAYRKAGVGGVPGVPGCGFLVKPSKMGEIKDNVPADYVVVYVLRGEGSYVDWNGQVHPLTPGCVAQRLPGKRHSTLLVADGQWSECFLVVEKTLYEALCLCGTIDPSRPVLRPGLHRALVDQFESILQDLSDGSGPATPRTTLKAHELIVSLYAFDAAARAPDPNDELVQAACGLLSEDLDARLSLPDLAGDLRLSY